MESERYVIKEGIEMRVQKKSGRPFKSTFKINTVKGECIHPITNNPAYIFVEDDSIVEKRQCIEYKGENNEK